LGVQFDFANDGQKAIDAAFCFNYGLILMDCMMPEVSGFEAAFEIRKHEFQKCRHTPIIACTAMDKDRIIDDCVHSGIDDYIAKPVDRDILKEKISYWSVIPMTLNPLTPSLVAEIRQLEKSEHAEPIDRKYLNLLYGLQQLEDVLELFLTVTENLLGQLESAITRHDAAIVRHMAHEIKGSSYAVSAREMAKLCLELERAGEEQDWPEAERLYAALGLAFARVRQFLQVKSELVKKMEQRA
ncbi:MAG: response regulator, partial [Terriglobales bacterium]